MLIDVTKNETTGKYEVETDVKPTPAPSGGAIAYAWDFSNQSTGDTGIRYYSFDTAPDDYLSTKRVNFADDQITILPNVLINSEYHRNNDNVFEIVYGDGREQYIINYFRNPSEDINIYEYQFNDSGTEEVPKLPDTEEGPGVPIEEG